VSAPLPPFRPAGICAKCSAEQLVLVYHAGAMAGCPCWPADPALRVITEHLCVSCPRCGYGWCEQTADTYPEADPEEDPMSIRKTAAAGQVTEVEGQPLVKTAAADDPWAADDEAALAQENTDADQG
jgi:hypothetical protein